MSKVSVASKQTNANARQQRGIALFRERGEKIEHVEGWRWHVPSCSGSGTYLVDLRDESCECLDHTPEGEVCKHVVAGDHRSRKERGVRRLPEEGPAATSLECPGRSSDAWRAS